MQLKNNPIGVKVQGAFDALNYYFITTLNYNPNWCGEKCVTKTSWN
jgi:hypothetical protein